MTIHHRLVLSACITFVLMLGIGCEKEVEFLQDRGGVFYERNQDTGFTGKYIEYWDEDKTKLKKVTYLKLGRYHGTRTWWYEDGQKSFEANYKNGERDGLATKWHENGQKSFEANYKNGKVVGLATEWHENGQKWVEGNYKNGKRDGLLTEWHENGRKRSVKNYKNGKIVATICDGNCQL